MGTVLIGPDGLEADAVVPQCLDNQYVSDATFAEMVRRGVDYRDETVVAQREKDFKTEFIRSLVYSSQVVIQRAYFKNSDFLYKNFRPENGESLFAFADLMRENAIIPYLFKEKSLKDDPGFDVSKRGDLAMRALLDELGDNARCVRLAVDDAANLQATTDMSTEFGTRLARLEYMSTGQRNSMASELFADPRVLQKEGMWKAFETALDELVDNCSRTARRLRREGDFQLARQHVYLNNFIDPAKGDKGVVNGQFLRPNRDNPFVFELKKYVDLVYNTNLPDLLNRYTFTPANMPSRMALQDSPGTGFAAEQIKGVIANRELLESIRRTFMAHTQRAMSLPLLSDLTMADVVEIRRLPQWERFKDLQIWILTHPLECTDRVEEFQQAFDSFQRALSGWYNQKYQRARTEEKYCSYVSLALSIGGALIVAGSNIGKYGEAIGAITVDRVANRLPKKIKGYAAKLMVGVYDMGARRLDADRTYTVELMQTDTELMREDLTGLLDSIRRNLGADIPGVSQQVADQGIL